jgi:hypothetical protein
MNRENLKLLLVATVCLAAGWSGPAVASAAVAFAVNSDKVDGKHAVGSGASIAARKGKLVATNPTTGRLPNNLIAKAPDAAKLGGVAAASMRVLALAPRSFRSTGGTTIGAANVGPWIPTTPDSGFQTTFLVPPGHTSGAPLKVDITVWSSLLCEYRAQLEFEVGDFAPNATTTYPLVGSFYVLPATSGYSTVTFDLASPSAEAPLAAGQLVILSFLRQASQGSCSNLEVPGLQVRY